MIVSGEEARFYNAVRLDSYACVNQGELVSADDQNGAVSWKDAVGELHSVTLGEHAIRIVIRSTLGR